MPAKKLTLSKETLRTLNDSELSNVAGGQTVVCVNSTICHSGVCNSGAVCNSAVCNSAVCNSAACSIVCA